MPIFLCEFSEGQYQAYLDVKRLLREKGVTFEVETTRDESKREMQRIWLAAPSDEAVAVVQRYFDKRHPLRSLGARAGSVLKRWRRR